MEILKLIIKMGSNSTNYLGVQIDDRLSCGLVTEPNVLTRCLELSSNFFQATSPEKQTVVVAAAAVVVAIVVVVIVVVVVVVVVVE